ncbi:MAG: nickel-dependent lactate racemase [Armatimonadetes bacterium]|nr:nickel-dependent lactate racemase [Armatimonadota bacterium]
MMNYGKTGLGIDLPDHWRVDVIRKTEMPVVADPVEAVRQALSRPVGSGTLVEEAGGCRSACVVICDITRPVPNGAILPTLIRELMASGISPNAITVLVATGLHRPNEGDELRELIGDDWVLETVKVVNHFARNDADHIHLGDTRRGTPVKIDRRFVEADLRVVVGLVEPHFMAGYSGGRKMITPGIAHQETITRVHSTEFLEDPKAANCVLEGNPLHEEQMEIAGMLGRCLAVNVILDEHRGMSFANFGTIEASHLEAVRRLRGYAEIGVPHKYKTVITSAAGYPLDKTYYQTVKGMVAAMDILERGGDLFIVSECSEGLGSPEFASAQRRMISIGEQEFLAEIGRQRFAAVDEWQTEMLLRVTRTGKVHLYSGGLTGPEAACTGVHCLASPGELRDALAAADRCAAVIPEGPYVAPVFGGS